MSLPQKPCRSEATPQSTISWTALLPLVGDHRGKAPRLIQSANPKGKVCLVAPRDLQRFIGDVEGENLFRVSFQGGHSIDPFRFAYARRDQNCIFKNCFGRRKAINNARLISSSGCGNKAMGPVSCPLVAVVEKGRHRHPPPSQHWARDLQRALPRPSAYRVHFFCGNVGLFSYGEGASFLPNAAGLMSFVQSSSRCRFRQAPERQFRWNKHHLDS
jgi:hypothetical protein